MIWLVMTLYQYQNHNLDGKIVCTKFIGQYIKTVTKTKLVGISIFFGFGNFHFIFFLINTQITSRFYAFDKSGTSFGIMIPVNMIQVLVPNFKLI